MQFSRPRKGLENRDKVWKKVKSLEFFSKLQKVLNIKVNSVFPRSQIPFNLARSQDDESQNKKFEDSLASALHCGYRTFVVHDHEKCLVAVFFKVSIVHLL